MVLLLPVCRGWGRPFPSIDSRLREVAVDATPIDGRTDPNFFSAGVRVAEVGFVFFEVDEVGFDDETFFGVEVDLGAEAAFEVEPFFWAADFVGSSPLKSITGLALIDWSIRFWR